MTLKKSQRQDESKTNEKLYRKAQKYLPGGVNSPVRSFKGVGGFPIFINKASGSKIYSQAGGEYIDYCLSWGAMFLGHANEDIQAQVKKALKKGTSFGAATQGETQLAKLIVESVPSIEMVRLTSSGTEAVMSAVRLARGFTGKNKIIKFQGAYHGHADYLLVKAGSGATTLGIPDSLGVPPDFAKHTLIAPYNDIIGTEEIIKKNSKDLAAIIIEPVLANCGVILPENGFLTKLRAITKKYNILLIFDEVITGFRLALGGAQEYFNIMPDLTCLGKILGGGLPIGAFGGRRDIMKSLAPLGGVYQAGTLSGNPLAVAAGIATLTYLTENQPYHLLETKTKKLCQTILTEAKKNNLDVQLNSIGSLFSIFFTSEEVSHYNQAITQDTHLFQRFFHSLLENGIYLSPSDFEANFLSIQHTDEELIKTVKAIKKALQEIMEKETSWKG